MNTLLRSITASFAVAGGMLVGGCGGSMNAMGDHNGNPSESIRFDLNGNKMYDPTVSNTRAEGTAMNQDGHAWTDRRDWHDQGRGDNNWTDRDVVMIRDTELPAPVRTTFERESHGYVLADTGRNTWNGKTCYTTKYRKDGATYRLVSDADGNLLAMKRID